MDKLINIRNGKTYIKSSKRKYNKAAHDKVLEELKSRIDGKLDGKTYYIPSYIDYSVPTSEKQMMSQIPWGTFVKCPEKDFSMGIYWNNFNGHRIDLDLHMNNGTESYGWYTNARGTDIIFSGDMTDARNGAAEVFYIKNGKEHALIATVNSYTDIPDVPLKFMVANKEPIMERRSDTPPVNIEDALFPPIELKFTEEREMTLGFYEDNKFYFYGGSMNKNVIPKRDLVQDALTALKSRVKSMMRLEELLKMAGAEIVRTYSDDVISLAPEHITQTTIIEIVDSLM